MKTKDITQISMFVAVTVILSQILIPIPFVPISLGVFAVYLSAVFLKPKQAFLCQLIYILLGFIGLPVFAKFSSGVGPTTGYLLAYPIMAFIVSFGIHNYKQKNKTVDFIFYFLLMSLSLSICYTLGTYVLSYMLEMTFVRALSVGVIPYIIGDIIKIVVTILFVMPLKNRVFNQLS